MREIDWLAARDPEPILSFLNGKVSDRKLRLFAVACCEPVWDLLPSEQSRTAIEVAERYADGLASDEELDKANMAAAEEFWRLLAAAHPGAQSEMEDPAAWASCRNIQQTVSGAALWAAWAVAGAVCHPELARIDRWSTEQSAAIMAVKEKADEVVAAEKAAQVELLHDIIGNPFRPVVLKAGWVSPALRCLAQELYSQATFEELPTLARSLEASGCEHRGLLAHCRWPGHHVRGCWAVDLILAKDR